MHARFSAEIIVEYIISIYLRTAIIKVIGLSSQKWTLNGLCTQPKKNPLFCKRELYSSLVLKSRTFSFSLLPLTG